MVTERRRRWAPKVRTGCLTCKKRKKRCDEKRPICETCVRGGYVCDGYDSQTFQTPDFTTAGCAQSHVNIPSIAIAQHGYTSRDGRSMSALTDSSSLFDVTADLALSIAEHKYTQFFVMRVGPVLATTKQWRMFWETSVPCASISNPSIHHAMLALSMAYESKYLSVDRSQVMAEQINLALRSTSSEPTSTYSMVVLCRLLAAISQGLGDWQRAMVHLRHGWRLIVEGVRHDQLDPITTQLLGPTFLCASIRTFDGMDELKHLQRDSCDTLLKLETIRTRFGKQMSILDWSSIKSGRMKTAIVVYWSLMTRALCAVIHPTPSTCELQDQKRSPISAMVSRLRMAGTLLTLDELCARSDILHRNLFLLLCTDDDVGTDLCDDFTQRTRILGENSLVQASTLHEVTNTDMSWFESRSVECDISVHLEDSGKASGRTPSCPDSQLSATLENKRREMEEYLEFICPYRSGLLPVFVNTS